MAYMPFVCHAACCAASQSAPSSTSKMIVPRRMRCEGWPTFVLHTCTTEVGVHACPPPPPAQYVKLLCTRLHTVKIQMPLRALFNSGAQIYLDDMRIWNVMHVPRCFPSSIVKCRSPRSPIVKTAKPLVPASHHILGDFLRPGNRNRPANRRRLAINCRRLTDSCH